MKPSTAISRREPSQAPFVPRPATGTAVLSNRTRNGSAPSRCRAWVIADVDGTVQSSRHDLIDFRDPASLRITETIDFYDFGVPVHVAAPPAAEVASMAQFIEGSGKSFGGPGSAAPPPSCRASPVAFRNARSSN